MNFSKTHRSLEKAPPGLSTFPAGASASSKDGDEAALAGLRRESWERGGCREWKATVTVPSVTAKRGQGLV